LLDELGLPYQFAVFAYGESQGWEVIMTQSKLTIVVERRWVEPAKRYAARHRTSLSKLISEYLRVLAADEQATTETPVLDRMTGILPKEVSKDEHKQHLDAKHLGP
jgi:hypothetical protein